MAQPVLVGGNRETLSRGESNRGESMEYSPGFREFRGLRFYGFQGFRGFGIEGFGVSKGFQGFKKVRVPDLTFPA